MLLENGGVSNSYSFSQTTLCHLKMMGDVDEFSQTCDHLDVLFFYVILVIPISSCYYENQTELFYFL